jgi:hypothetical protein
MQSQKKRSQEHRRTGHVEAGAVVADEEGRLPVLAFSPDLDASLLHLRRELPRVAERVLHESPEAAHVAV